MIDRGKFYERLEVCRLCEFWRGVCLKGHALQSPAGCPLKKFEPIGGASYHPDVPFTVSKVEATARCCTADAADLVPLTWAQATAAFTLSMATAVKNGFVFVEDADYQARMTTCRACEEYRHFQCRLCKCVCLFKAKLAHETCPRKKWRVLMT